jgi:hypothetical protein
MLRLVTRPQSQRIHQCHRVVQRSFAAFSRYNGRGKNEAPKTAPRDRPYLQRLSWTEDLRWTLPTINSKSLWHSIQVWIQDEVNPREPRYWNPYMDSVECSKEGWILRHPNTASTAGFAANEAFRVHPRPPPVIKCKCSEVSQVVIARHSSVFSD